MFRRRLKKEQSKYKYKVFFIAIFVIALFILTGEYLLLNFSFGSVNLISPIAKENRSKLLTLQAVLDKKQIQYASFSLNSDGSYSVLLKDGSEIILSEKKDLNSQLASLQLILSRLTIEGKKLKKLDFRFDNPVVSF
jgi:hypothetical protein